jgi:hypothetical protein
VTALRHDRTARGRQLSALRRHWLALTVAIGALAAAAVSLGDAPLAIRVPVVFVFAILGPGAAVVPLLGLRDPLGEFALAIGVSLAADVAVGTTLLYAHAWSPQAGLAILVVVALAAAGAQIVTAGRRA